MIRKTLTLFRQRAKGEGAKKQRSQPSGGYCLAEKGQGEVNRSKFELSITGWESAQQPQSSHLRPGKDILQTPSYQPFTKLTLGIGSMLRLCHDEWIGLVIQLLTPLSLFVQSLFAKAQSNFRLLSISF